MLCNPHPAHPLFNLTTIPIILTNRLVTIWGNVMNLLFRREQTGVSGRVKFRLWAKTELDEDEEHIVRRYRFDEARLIQELQPNLMRTAALIGLGVAAVVFLLAMRFWFGGFLALAAGAAAGYFFYDRKRESLFVRDLIHGRYFVCDSVVDLAKKEARVSSIAAVLRQVMETAKHWDGTETVPIEALSKEEAKYLVVRSL